MVDPIPTLLPKSCLPELLPIPIKIVNSSIKMTHVPKSLKNVLVCLLLKIENLVGNILKNYGPVPNQQFVSKMVKSH